MQYSSTNVAGARDAFDVSMQRLGRIIQTDIMVDSRKAARKRREQ
jgi:hypothetical protein